MKEHVGSDLVIVEDWKTDPAKVFETMVKVAEAWRVVEKLHQRNGSPKSNARVDNSSRSSKLKEQSGTKHGKSSSDSTRWRCRETGRIKKYYLHQKN